MTNRIARIAYGVMLLVTLGLCFLMWTYWPEPWAALLLGWNALVSCELFQKMVMAE